MRSPGGHDDGAWVCVGGSGHHAVDGRAFPAGENGAFRRGAAAAGPPTMDRQDGGTWPRHLLATLSVGVAPTRRWPDGASRTVTTTTGPRSAKVVWRVEHRQLVIELRCGSADVPKLDRFMRKKPQEAIAP